MNHFERGFMAKCAERGISRDSALRLIKAAAESAPLSADNAKRYADFAAANGGAERAATLIRENPIPTDRLAAAQTAYKAGPVANSLAGMAQAGAPLLIPGAVAAAAALFSPEERDGRRHRARNALAAGLGTLLGGAAYNGYRNYAMAKGDLAEQADREAFLQWAAQQNGGQPPASGT